MASGIVSIKYSEALEAALGWGWIDGQNRRIDETWYAQKFTPRRARSIWSKINRANATALIAAGKMKPAGLAEVERAKQDGRWARAYDSPSRATVPDDLAAALAKNARALGVLRRPRLAQPLRDLAPRADGKEARDARAAHRRVRQDDGPSREAVSLTAISFLLAEPYSEGRCLQEHEIQHLQRLRRLELGDHCHCGLRGDRRGNRARRDQALAERLTKRAVRSSVLVDQA